MNLYAACLPIPVLLATCGLILGRDGFPSRAPALALHYHSARNDKLHQHSVSLETLARNEIPVFGDPAGDRTCLIWGDSHAMALVAGLDAACKKHHIRGVQATYAGTAPVRGFHITTGLGLREKAVPHADAVLEYARRNNIDYVVLAAYWTRYAHNPDLERCLSDTVRTLAQQGSQVAIVLDYAKQSEDVPLMLARRAFRGAPTSDCGTPMQRHLDVNASVNRAIGHAAGGIALVLDPAPFLTDDSGLWRSEIDGIALYYDDDHLSTPGALRLAPMFDSMLETMQSRTRATND